MLGLIAINWLIIADQSQHGIEDPDCLLLADLHSDAVDYPKSGMPVSVKKIPRTKFKQRPDFQAPETLSTKNSPDFYPSQRAIGKLFRKIDLPHLETEVPVSRQERRRIREGRGGNSGDVDRLTRSLANTHVQDNPLLETMEEHVNEYIPTTLRPDQETRIHIAQMFKRYCSEFTNLLASHTLSNAKTALLSEEEAIIGTIAQKTSQPRKRKELMASLREKTDTLVKGVREELAGDDDVTAYDSLQQAWAALELAISEPKKTVGAQSFAWVALGVIFDAIKEIEDEKRSRTGYLKL